jgi:hypothetical protein
MILHVVTFTFRDDVTDEQLDAADEALARLPGRIDALRSYSHGRDLRLRPGTGDYAVVALVDDEDGLTAYLDHPDHEEAVRTAVTPLVLTRQAVQITIGTR